MENQDSQQAVSSTLNVPSTSFAAGDSLTIVNVELSKTNDDLMGITLKGGAPNCPCIFVTSVHKDAEIGKLGVQVGDALLSVCEMVLDRSSALEHIIDQIKRAKNPVKLSFVSFKDSPEYKDVESSTNLKVLMDGVRVNVTEAFGIKTAKEYGMQAYVDEDTENILEIGKLWKEHAISRSTLRDKLDKIKKSYDELEESHRTLGQTLSEMAVKEVDIEVNTILSKDSQNHKSLADSTVCLSNTINTYADSVRVYSAKALGDYNINMQKYQELKKQYLSMSLTISRLDEEENKYISSRKQLSRLSNGNTLYRYMLQKRAETRKTLAELENVIHLKMEMLTLKDQQTIDSQTLEIFKAMRTYYQSEIKI